MARKNARKDWYLVTADGKQVMCLCFSTESEAAEAARQTSWVRKEPVRYTLEAPKA
jgi:hypothetical protein